MSAGASQFRKARRKPLKDEGGWSPACYVSWLAHEGGECIKKKGRPTCEGLFVLIEFEVVTNDIRHLLIGIGRT